jgi:hypothetical protein
MADGLQRTKCRPVGSRESGSQREKEGQVHLERPEQAWGPESEVHRLDKFGSDLWRIQSATGAAQSALKTRPNLTSRFVSHCLKIMRL